MFSTPAVVSVVTTEDGGSKQPVANGLVGVADGQVGVADGQVGVDTSEVSAMPMAPSLSNGSSGETDLVTAVKSGGEER